MLFTGSKVVAGLDIGSSAMKLVELVERKGEFWLQRLGVEPLSPEDSDRLIRQLLAALDADSGPEIVLVPMLLLGLGMGSLASQLGAVTVSAVPTEQSAEVGGIQNTMTNLGASIGTALAGSLPAFVRADPLFDFVRAAAYLDGYRRSLRSGKAR